MVGWLMFLVGFWTEVESMVGSLPKAMLGKESIVDTRETETNLVSDPESEWIG